MADQEPAPDDWRRLALAAMETALGPSDGVVTRVVTPSRFGDAAGGRADVVHFRQRLAGVVHVTRQLIGEDAQIRNSLGNYELAICDRTDDEWSVRLIASLAGYTLEEQIEPGHTMDLGAAAPNGSTISALLFADFGRFLVRGRRAGLLLCIGVTAGELAACRNGGRRRVETALRAAGVYPFTELRRPSAIVN